MKLSHAQQFFFDVVKLAHNVPCSDKRLFAYQMAMALARSMRSKGLISAKEYAKIDTIIAEKYGISSCSIFR